MPKVIQAVYENGVFKPIGKIDLREHQQVEIVLSERPSATQKTQGILKGLTMPPSMISPFRLNSCLKNRDILARRCGARHACVYRCQYLRIPFQC